MCKNFCRTMEKYMQDITPNKDSENLDYNDVFGGPPRRYSMQGVRVRRSLSELLASEDGGTSSSPSMPKFREARVARRPSLSANFFDDIFRGDESYSSPTRTHHDWENVFGSSQSSRITRPVAGFATSLPTQSSLPAKWRSKPVFSPSVSQNEAQSDGSTNRINTTRSSSSSFRFYHQSPLVSFSREDSSSTVTSDPKDNVQSSKKVTDVMESPTSGDQFHFSIYKWAGRGVPVLTPHIERSNVKELTANDRFSSSGGKIEGEFTRNESPRVMMDQDSLKTECEEKESNGVNLNAAQVTEQECETLNKDEARSTTPSFRKSFSPESKIFENSSDPFEDLFLVQELSDDNGNVTQSDETKWSVGKKGNIRSLLANLQLVLWPGNGWKPIPLVDLIEVNAVKRAYQKALLRIHPDKLQQNDAASHHKYIAERVFDILQEAWDQFNALAPL
ncbi:J domain-containing protein required for chloroplast accumulation response 1-like [Dorcoceras hygrometricum]|uniref:J domain-containing protein required for chloroplast accumulation response 1-like n=1 Tax=Dorcoceras hygrometricum TaxID=472368 RepID=A0A2Z7BQJ2_9LAMI|nr:J domain-containing protein required for chloroplast accumulation response 1-like [Dorcoceras hygrometricum]